MEHQTDLQPVARRDSRREPNRARLPEMTAKQERLSITQWITQTLDEMKRLTGWFKEDPEVARIQALSAPYPNIQAKVTRDLDQLHRRANLALEEAVVELDGVTGKREREPIQIEQPFRLLRMPDVDPSDREAWREVKIQVMKEFEAAFGQHTLARKSNDFEIKTWTPTRQTTLEDRRAQGKKSIRVRSESVGGVRVDGLVDAQYPDRWLEYRIYDIGGHFMSVSGNEDPVERILQTAEYNASALQYARKARKQRTEHLRILFGDQTKGGDFLRQPMTAQEIVQAEDWRLALPKDYEQTAKETLGVTSFKEKTTGPVIGPLPEHLKPYLQEEPRVAQIDAFQRETTAMNTAYGPEVAGYLGEQYLTNQEDFDAFYKLYASAVQNETLKPEKAILIRKVFDALQTEGRKRNLMGKGSYAYVVESYNKIENDLPQLKESIETVQELLQDPTTSPVETISYQKELAYLKHLLQKAETEQQVSIHTQVGKFLDSYQTKLTLTEINDILRADQALDTASPEDRKKAEAELVQAMDFPARLVLREQIDIFVEDYARFTTNREKQTLQQRSEQLMSAPGIINFWDMQNEQTDWMNSIKARSWERVAMESLGRLQSVWQEHHESLSNSGVTIVSNLRDQLQKAVPSGGERFDVEKKQHMQQILRTYEPVEFEQYLTKVLSEMTGQDRRPAWSKTEAELATEHGHTTFVHEPANQTPSPVETEFELEDVSEEIPGLVRALRGVRTPPGEATQARTRAREILEQAGSEELIEITDQALQRLDQLMKLLVIDDRVYRRALARLLNTNNFNDRENAVQALLKELSSVSQHREKDEEEQRNAA